MKWSKYPEDMQVFICAQRRKGVPARQVRILLSEKFPDAPQISVGGIYHVERRRNGTYRPKQNKPLEQPKITLVGPDYSIPEGYVQAERIAA